MNLPKLNPLGLNLGAYRGMSINMLKTLLPDTKIIKHTSIKHSQQQPISRTSSETIHVITDNTNNSINKVLGFYC